eukprot:scaffold59901_cov64-Cyclotella_meneghiniana.AAC.2
MADGPKTVGQTSQTCCCGCCSSCSDVVIVAGGYCLLNFAYSQLVVAIRALSWPVARVKLLCIKHSCIRRDENEHIKRCCCAGEGIDATKGQPASFSACSRHLGLVLVSQLFIWQIMPSAL